MKTTIPETGELWVNCPVCGNKIMRAEFASCVEKCDVCGSVLRICATKRFVTTIVKDENEALIEILHRYHKELLGLAIEAY